MEETKKLFVFLILILPSISAFDNNVIPTDFKECHCPNFVQTADFSNPDALRAVQNNMLKSLWEISYPEMSAIGKEFKEIIFKMADSRVPFWRANALATSQWIWAYLPQLVHNPNLCSYAKMVNHTVAFMKNNDCPKILSAIKDSIVALGEAGALHLTSGMIVSKCSPESQTIKTVGDPCHEDGFEYEFDEMWELVGWEYPLKYRNIVHALYKSSNDVDQAMAVLATSALSKQMTIIENNYEEGLKYQLFAMATPGILQECCCNDYLSEVQALAKKLELETGRVFQLAKESTNCPLN